MTRKEAEALKDIDPRMKDQAAMVWKIERAMRKKVKALFPTFEEMPGYSSGLPRLVCL